MSCIKMRLAHKSCLKTDISRVISVPGCGQTQRQKKRNSHFVEQDAASHGFTRELESVVFTNEVVASTF